MIRSSLKLAAIVFVLTATAACSKPDSGNNDQQNAASATAEPTDNGTASTDSGNNVVQNADATTMSGNNITTNY